MGLKYLTLAKNYEKYIRKVQWGVLPPWFFAEIRTHDEFWPVFDNMKVMFKYFLLKWYRSWRPTFFGKVATFFQLYSEKRLEKVITEGWFNNSDWGFWLFLHFRPGEICDPPEILFKLCTPNLFYKISDPPKLKKKYIV